ncbi:hypothetical protein SAMN05421630_107385 [Prauserella marina]|uniref:Uncharacterized protein n=1 Tax=Prauserella marina TaxID=530584 RepID=A0A1G6TZY8_9PSEU|nr:hypothetical protein DES30_10655 [Prauserella marina]SDD34504.1 hypothetical protein SAMN05421630_107385 [Prauserella marina]
MASARAAGDLAQPLVTIGNRLDTASQLRHSAGFAPDFATAHVGKDATSAKPPCPCEPGPRTTAGAPDLG